MFLIKLVNLLHMFSIDAPLRRSWMLVHRLYISFYFYFFPLNFVEKEVMKSWNLQVM